MVEITSAALPTRGRRINAINSRLMSPVAVNPLMLSTRYSAVRPVKTVTTTKSTKATMGLSFWCSSSSLELELLDELEEELLEEEEERRVERPELDEVSE